MRRRFSLLLVVAAITAIVPAAGLARHANDTSGCAFSKVTMVGTGLGGSQTFYIDDRADAPPVPGVLGGGGTWIYMESNNFHGLQTGGRNAVAKIVIDDEATEAAQGFTDPCDNDATRAGDTVLL